jgi:hypothetical protein
MMQRIGFRAESLRASAIQRFQCRELAVPVFEHDRSHAFLFRHEGTIPTTDTLGPQENAAVEAAGRRCGQTVEAVMKQLLLAAAAVGFLVGHSALAQSAYDSGPTAAPPVCPTLPNSALDQACPANVGSGTKTFSLAIALPETTGTIANIDLAANAVKLDDGKTYVIPMTFDVTTLMVGERVKITFTDQDGTLTAKEVTPVHNG